MTDSSLEILSDDTLIGMLPKPPVGDLKNLNDNQLLRLVELQEKEEIDHTTGAPGNVRLQVGAAQLPEDKLKTLQSYFPDAIPVEVFDPEHGASKYGRGNFIFTNPQTGKLTLFDEDIRFFGVPLPLSDRDWETTL